MSRGACTLKLLLCLGVWLTTTGETFAKGGRGGSRGGGRSFSRNGFKGGGGFIGGKSNGGLKIGSPSATKSASLIGRSDPKGAKPDAGPFAPGKSPKDILPSSRSPIGQKVFARDGSTLDHHSSRELNKLKHRRQIADHLRSISEKNGNENLKRVADDMDLRAREHYDRQMAKFDPAYTPNGPFADPTRQRADRIEPLGKTGSQQTPIDSVKTLTDSPGKLTGTENALFRQVRNEERRLAKRLESAQRMRELANQSGDQELLQTANRLEEWAMNDFDQRMMKVSDFQQRHGLPEVSNHLPQ